MIRLQENVPEVYVKESRDFQLFCRLYDLINNSTRYSIESTINLLDPLKCSDRILPLLSTRVGFFPKSEYNTLAFRNIINAFSYILKYKGSKQGIEMALNVILKAENNYDKSDIRIDRNNSIIKVLTKKSIQNEALLRDVLSYVIPIGYDLEIGEYKEAPKDQTTTQLTIDINAKQKVYNSGQLSQVLKYSEDLKNRKPNIVTNPDEMVGSYTGVKILNAEDIAKVIGDQNGKDKEGN